MFKDITAMIEAAHDDEADPYIELLSELQGHLARWRGIANDQGRRRDRLLVHSIEEELVDELTAPPFLNDGAFKPIFGQMRMVQHDKLEVIGDLATYPMHELK